MLQLRVDKKGFDIWTRRIGRGRLIPQQVAREGQIFARKIAPKRTGALREGIQLVYGTRGNAWLVSHRPQNKDGRNRPYQLWMHGMGGKNTSTNNYRGKDPRYMFTTAKYMENVLQARMRKALK